MSEERNYSSPYDELFDAFIANGFRRDEDNKLHESASRHKTLSYARKASADMSKRFGGVFDNTTIYAGFQMRWDKEAEWKYSFTQETLDKMAQVLGLYGYNVTAPAE